MSVIFRNKTNQEQSLLIGDGYIVGPYEEVVLEPQEASVAKQRYAAILEPVQMEGVGTAIEEQRDVPIWLANMAGDPDAPAQLEVKPEKNKITGQMQMKTVENMLAKPLDFSVRYRERTEKKKIGSATHEFKPAKRKETIRVWERRPVSPGLARAILRRASNMGPGAQGWVIASRPPSGFEPDASWSLDEIRSWLYMVDYKLESRLGPSEGEIRKLASSERDAEKRIQREKLKHLKRVFLRAANPRYVLPTRSEFEAFLGRSEVRKALGEEQSLAEAESIAEVQTSAPVKKKAPRRKKKASKRTQVTASE